MCFKIINFYTIRLISIFDLILTGLTVALALHIYNLNSELVEVEKEKYNQRKLQNPFMDPNRIYGVDQNTAKGLVYCFIIAPLFIFLVNGWIICCSCFVDDTVMMNEMLQLLLTMELLFLGGMTILYHELYSYVIDDHEKVIEGPQIRIPYAICFISRLIVILVLVIKMIQYNKQRREPAAAVVGIELI